MSIFDNLFATPTTTTEPPKTEVNVNLSGQPQAGNPQSVNPSVNPIRLSDMSALSHLDSRATQVINKAREEAKKVKKGMIEEEEILLALLSDREIVKTMQDASVDVAKLTRDLEGKQVIGSATQEPTLSEATKQVLEQAYSSAKSREVEFITPEDILLALLSGSSPVVDMLKGVGLEKGKMEEKLSKNPEFKTGKKSALKEFGIDLTEAAALGKLDPVAGRDKETRRLIHILIRRTKNNPIIIGEAGTGKTAIVEGLAQAIAQKRVPVELQNRKLIQLEVSSLIAGASHRGEFEERLQSIIKEVMASSGQIILFIDEIHTIIGAGESGGALDASNILKPYLARGQIQVIGATTTSEFRRYFEKDRAFERRFQSVMCDEPSEESAIEMIKILQPKYEKFHSVQFTPESLVAAVKLSKRYIGERFLPDKAIDLLDEAAAELRLQHAQGQRAEAKVTPEDVEKIVAGWTGIPITKLTEKESDKLLHMEELIHKKYINHDRAVKAVAEAVRRGRIGLANANRPIASFVFLGPTGTGKTEIAKVLAEIMFGSANNMIRLDMSEYMEKHEVAKLIGAPPGYVGYEEGGQLTEAVRKKPYSVVLLDEVEKAHPDVFNIMLQVLEDGRLTDNKGNTISFKNTIIIATSNVGSAIIRDTIMASEEKKKKLAESQPSLKADNTAYYQGVGASPVEPVKPVESVGSVEEKKDGTASLVATDDKAKDNIEFKKLSKLVLDELNKFFKPEFLNRFDEIVIFEPLSEENMMKIAELGIESTRKMLKEQNVAIQISQLALKQLAHDGYDPVYGARPLRRLIQRSIENPIAIYLINKSLNPGDVVVIDYDPKEDKFIFNRQAGQPPVVSPQGGNEIATSPASPDPRNDSGMNGGQQVPPTVPPVMEESSQSLPSADSIMDNLAQSPVALDNNQNNPNS